MEFFRFLKWHFDQWSFSQRVWILGAASFGWGVPEYVKTGEPGLAIYIGWALWATVFAKWFIWDSFKASWAKYREHRNSLLSTIRDSDR